MNPPAGVVRLRLSSTLEVDAGDGARSGRELGSRKARTLLALLASARGRPVATDRIVEALWGAAPPADPAANVATLVSRVRRTLGTDLVAGRSGAYALAGAWSLDLVEMIVEPAAGDTVAANLTPVGRVFYGFSTFLCVPNAVSQPGGYALGAQAGPAAIRQVVTDAGFTRFRKVAETPFNHVYEARP